MASPLQCLYSAPLQDDVLHEPTLNNFGDAVSQEDAERLLTFLTAPYIRIPLLLEFFKGDRLSSLSSSALQELLTAALFEPGKWAATVESPTTTPAPEAVQLGSPCGYLFNELVQAPQSTLHPLATILKGCQNLVKGTSYDSPYAGLTFFAMRTAARPRALMHGIPWKMRLPVTMPVESAAAMGMMQGCSFLFFGVLTAWVLTFAGCSTQRVQFQGIRGTSS